MLKVFVPHKGNNIAPEDKLGHRYPGIWKSCLEFGNIILNTVDREHALQSE
jgi:hypothetical protein